MHIVYLIEFNTQQFPNKYVGSKSNCNVINGKIYGKRGLYEGSSEDKQYKQMIKTTPYSLYILGEFENYKDALSFESTYQKEHNVVSSIEYFNKSIANENNYSNPEYATYKNTITGKVARLKRNDLSVISGEWVGVSKGSKLSEKRKKKFDMSGEKNHFYGKTHTERTKKEISVKNKIFYESEEGIKYRKEASKRMSILAKKIKTDEHKRKIGIKNKNKIMLKNINTLESIKIDKSELHLYDSSVWVNPAKLSQRRDTCVYCGITSTAGNISRWHNEKCKGKKE